RHKYHSSDQLGPNAFRHGLITGVKGFLVQVVTGLKRWQRIRLRRNGLLRGSRTLSNACHVCSPALEEFPDCLFYQRAKDGHRVSPPRHKGHKENEDRRLRIEDGESGTIIHVSI